MECLAVPAGRLLDLSRMSGEGLNPNLLSFPLPSVAAHLSLKQKGLIYMQANITGYE